MKILAIETATPCVGCALWSDEGPVASFIWPAGQRHAEMLMPAIDELCMRAGWSVADLGGVAVDVGPGLFTGLRVGLATANTIATARGIPAPGVTSLEVLAHPHRRRRGLLAPWSTPGGGRSTGRCTRAVSRMRGAGATAPSQAVAAPGGSEPRGRRRRAGQPEWSRSRRRGRRLAVPGRIRGGGYRGGGGGGKWPSPLAVAELGFGRMVAQPWHHDAVTGAALPASG